MSGLAMSDSKPAAPPRAVASLGPLLLARKGTAKPAMRAQLDGNARGNSDHMIDELAELASSQEDLGWNDMGENDLGENDIGVEGAEATPAEDLALPAATAEPAVRRQQVDLLHRIADANLAAFQAAENHNCSAAPETGRRAAFTLRLDEERHLRLRLASTVQGESAQTLVTRALDSLLSQMPEIEQLATQVRPLGRRGKTKA
jgi:predicted HicB family RNase H-like nuclease